MKLSLTAVCLLFTACDTTVPKLGKELSGTVRIPASFAPRLAPEGEGEPRVEDEPNTVPPDEVDDLGLIETDTAGISVQGSFLTDAGAGFDPSEDIRDRFLFEVSGEGSVSLSVVQCGSGESNMRLIEGTVLADDDSNLLGYTAFSGANDGPDREVISAVLHPATTYLIQLRYLLDTGACTYTLGVTSVSGTVVSTVYVGAYLVGDPFVINDPIGNNQLDGASSKLPIAGTLVTGLELGSDGDMTGSFAGLRVPPSHRVYLYAFADNDGSNTGETALDFALNGPPSDADFVMGSVQPVDVEKDDITDLELELDSYVTDADFDGIADADGDNCPFGYNPDQADDDEDGVGDVCDDCPDEEDPDQENYDGAGKGDACNDDAGDDCPYQFLRPVGSDCPIDSDGDEVDDAVLACPEGLPICLISELVENADDLCPSVPDPDQLDNDGDAIDLVTKQVETGPFEGGDECDGDDDNDGFTDEEDNCSYASNDGQEDLDTDGVGDICDLCPSDIDPDQEDFDLDGVGDICDLCPSDLDPDQEDFDSDGLGDACDDDADGDGFLDATDDNCLFVPNDQTDSDNDGVGDDCDNCPDDANEDQADADDNGVGDVCQ